MALRIAILGTSGAVGGMPGAARITATSLLRELAWPGRAARGWAAHERGEGGQACARTRRQRERRHRCETVVRERDQG
jgi:hypothetical protein